MSLLKLYWTNIRDLENGVLPGLKLSKSGSHLTKTVSHCCRRRRCSPVVGHWRQIILRALLTNGTLLMSINQGSFTSKRRLFSQTPIGKAHVVSVRNTLGYLPQHKHKPDFNYNEWKNFRFFSWVKNFESMVHPRDIKPPNNSCFICECVSGNHRHNSIRNVQTWHRAQSVHPPRHNEIRRGRSLSGSIPNKPSPPQSLSSATAFLCLLFNYAQTTTGNTTCTLHREEK